MGQGPKGPTAPERAGLHCPQGPAGEPHRQATDTKGAAEGFPVGWLGPQHRRPWLKDRQPQQGPCAWSAAEFAEALLAGEL